MCQSGTSVPQFQLRRASFSTRHRCHHTLLSSVSSYLSLGLSMLCCPSSHPVLPTSLRRSFFPCSCLLFVIITFDDAGSRLFLMCCHSLSCCMLFFLSLCLPSSFLIAFTHAYVGTSVPSPSLFANIRISRAGPPRGFSPFFRLLWLFFSSCAAVSVAFFWFLPTFLLCSTTEVAAYLLVALPPRVAGPS